MPHERLSSSSSSSSQPGFFTLLVTVLICLPTTPAYSPPLQIRQEGQLQGAEFLPQCAQQCVYDKIFQQFPWCKGQLGCLCGKNPQPYRELLWSCIDDQKLCPPEAHKNTEVAVMGVCDKVLPASSSSSTSPSSTAPASTSPAKTSTSQPATAQPAKGESKDSSGLSTAAIAGISVGVVALLGLIVGACFLLAIMRNRKKRREQIHSMVLEPTSPRGPSGEWKVHGVNNYSGWASIDSADSNSNAGHYYNSKSRLTPILTDIPTEKRGAPAINTSPVSPVSPNGKSAAAVAVPTTQTKVVASRKIIENHHLQIDMPPSFSYTPATPATQRKVEEPVSPVSPISDFNRAQLARTSSGSVSSYHGVLPGQAFTTDSRSVRSISPPLEDSNRHTCSAATMPRIQRERTPEPSTPPPEYAPVIAAAPSGATDSRRSSRNTSAATAAGGGMARTDSIAWRRELEEAAERAMTRVVQSEQSIQEESAGERRRKGSIPGLDRFARRVSRDTRGDEESSLVNNGETGSSFWNRKGGRVSTPPRSPGFFSPGRRRDSGATGSKRSSDDVGTAV
ncbi:hypothetical protein L873DRAFT_1815307 [Choiromyces venosus 120613-1]|uniref:Uncharacterized protein n=1 Tax=Choiromyces venosus 120613-1 TaxID=1336337 RepID=A0A3N4JAU9_9PEZI|nr:hypothetical protein L873DRAFT_1815307 [Choiromyces venosus 120613-1]